MCFEICIRDLEIFFLNLKFHKKPQNLLKILINPITVHLLIQQNVNKQINSIWFHASKALNLGRMTMTILAGGNR